MTKTNGCNPLTIVVVASARLPEFAIPERLVAVDLEPKKLKHANHFLHTIYRDDNVVTVDTHLPAHLKEKFAVKWHSPLLSNPHENQGSEYHGLNREAES